MKKISIIIPAYNEEKNLPLVVSELQNIFAQEILQSKYNYEIIFIDDGSRDNTLNILKKLASENAQVKFIEFSRNFGKELAVSAGLKHAVCDAAIIMDADLQHPPREIPNMLLTWHQANGEVDMVIGVRTKNKGEGLVKKLGSKVFYKIMNLLSETEMIPRETDFRLLDKKVLAEFNKLGEHNRITRGLINWLGFRKVYFEFAADERLHGVASYSPVKLFKLALNSFISHSLLPLRLTGYVGLVISTLMFFLGITVFVEKRLLGDPLGWSITGTAELAIINTFLVGIVLCALGLIALYIESVHAEVAGRPLFIVRDTNIESN
jgi:dolichol-phosphate mannosyltransferase